MDNPNECEPPDDKFCDLVMKGGVTSGVVYPSAIEILSHKYRFKSIGGTSAGAIAAAITAAAEYNRRKGSRAGFDILKGLSGELQEEVAPGRRKLITLFQPDPGVERLFAVLMSSLNRSGTLTRILAVLWGFVSAYWFASLMALVLSAGFYFMEGPLAATLMLLVSLTALIGLFTYRDVTRNMVANGFGLCTGMSNPRFEGPALVPWLHDHIQRAAGLGKDDPPLTFGQLWKAPGFPPPWLKPSANVRSIDLQMFSTNLSQGRPYILPMPAKDAASGPCRGDESLFFRKEELRRYLPADVFGWILKHGTPYVVDPTDGGRNPGDNDPSCAHMIELPPPEHFPVLLAARMSLSFPVLFAGVPLWAINYDAPRGQRTFRRCWFSDGGLCANFPMHLFDGLVPSWPTFGIDLEPVLPGRELVYLPRHYCEGYGERWNDFDEQAGSASRCGGFFIAMVKVMQNWNDNALSRMPGVRDRIARVRLRADEGGMNLNMEADTINAVTERGKIAVQQLIEAFDSSAANAQDLSGWEAQRWIRLCVLLKVIEARGPGVELAMETALPHATSYEDLITRGGRFALPGYAATLSPTEQQAMREVLNALGTLARAQSVPSSFQAVPKPELRVRPPL